MCIYGVLTISRLLNRIGLFCKRALQKRPIFSEERYNFKEPTNRSHAIAECKQSAFTTLCAHTSMCTFTQGCAEYRLFYRALLQKRPMISRSLLIISMRTYLDVHIPECKLSAEYRVLYRLVQNIDCFIGLFCKRDLSFAECK